MLIVSFLSIPSPSAAVVTVSHLCGLLNFSTVPFVLFLLLYIISFNIELLRRGKSFPLIANWTIINAQFIKYIFVPSSLIHDGYIKVEAATQLISCKSFLHFFTLLLPQTSAQARLAFHQ